jgi:hypothetical protein
MDDDPFDWVDRLTSLRAAVLLAAIIMATVFATLYIAGCLLAQFLALP